MLKIKVTAAAPAARVDDLAAWIDLGDERPLADVAMLEKHPAWADLTRRKKQGEISGHYLAVGAQPLVYLPAAGAKYWEDDEKIRVLAAKALDCAQSRQVDTLVFYFNGEQGAAAAPLAAEGLALRAYRFDKYKSGNGNNNLPQVTFVCDAKEKTATARLVNQQLALVESVNAARDLVNEPGSVATPAYLEEKARAVAKQCGLKIQVLGERQLKAQGYNGLLSVGRGGTVPPRMIILRYEPKGRARKGVHLGLLGKGITFDTGGICIKPGGGMWEMKGDMAGAAATLYAMEAIARLAPPVRVTGILVAAQNYPDANATLPGDIFIAKNGKSVHIDNTDAEGRLILSDGLCRMGEEGVTDLVDVATLTGACVRALGDALSGILGNNGFADIVAEVASTQGEECWRLPMVEEYAQRLKFEIADLNNISTTKPLQAGATTAALFLREFVPQGVNWAHLDIAGTFIAEGDYKYFRPGATGVMVRTFAALAQHMAEYGE